MSNKYRYGHRPKAKRHIVAVSVLVCLLVMGGLAYFVVHDLRRNVSTQVEGKSEIVGQVVGDETAKKTIDEPLYAFQLPKDWKLKERINTEALTGVTWQATKKNQDNRWVTVYVDKLPLTKSVNRLLPVTPNGNTLLVGDLSDNCATFTDGGTTDANKAINAKDVPAKWSGVDFICNLPSVVDNQIGVGAVGGVNQVTLTGTKGAHKYFIIYTDHNIQPNYSILTDMLQSFRTK